MEIIFKKKKQNPGGSYVGAIAVFILAIIIGLVSFFVTAQRTIESSSQERMRNNVARQSEHLRTILNIHYSYLEGIAEKMGEGGDLLSEENMQMLTTFQESTALDRTALGAKHAEDLVKIHVRTEHHLEKIPPALHQKNECGHPVEHHPRKEQRP